MANSLIRNRNSFPITLPFPFKGMVEPGGVRAFALDVPTVLAIFGGSRAMASSGIIIEEIAANYNGAIDSFNTVSSTYDLAGGVLGRPDGNAAIIRFPVVRAFTLPAGLALSRAVAGAVANAISVFSLQKNAVQFGTITFAALSGVGVLASAADTVFSVTDILTVLAPNPQDLLLGDVGVVLAGSRSLA